MDGYERQKELKAFDEARTGVKGLHDAGITTVPRIFTLPAPIPASTTAVAVPTIDLGGPSAEVAAEIRKAAFEWGFFQVVNHGVSPEAMAAMLEGVRRFFEGDAEERKAVYSRDMGKKVRYNSNQDLFRSRVANWRDTLSVIVSPDGAHPDEIPASCRQACMEYLKHAVKLGELLLRLLSQALGLDPSHLEDLGCAEGQFLLSHYYPPCPQPEKAIGTSPHRDSSFLTILLQDLLGGLQVLHGDQWVEVTPVPGALVVNIGDLLQLLSNGALASVEHRVVANGKAAARISVAFFLSNLVCSKEGDSYGPIPELLSEKTPPIFKHISARDYVSLYFSAGLGEKSPLQELRL